MLAKHTEISILLQTQNQMVHVLFESLNKKCFGFSRTTEQVLHVDFYALDYSAACCSVLSYKILTCQSTCMPWQQAKLITFYFQTTL
jgi:hypothetical protein